MEDFDRSVAGEVRSIAQVCVPAPCGWAFSDSLAGAVLPGHRYWNRYQDVDGNGRYTPPPPPGQDVNLDTDDDLIPNDYDDRVGGGIAAFEEWCELRRPCDGNLALELDWGCPGRNAGRAPHGAPASACR